MKKFLLVIIISFVGLQINGQVPEKFNYQGVLRNASGDLIMNTNVTIQLSILEGSTSANASFIEQHNVTTNSYGQFAVIIGNGTNQTGSIDAIDWSVGQVYLKTELDESGGTTFTELSTVMLITVPYALYANEVANKDDADADPGNEIQDLNLTNNTLKITNHPSPTQIDLAPFQGNNTDEQTLSLSGTELSITGGNMVDLSPIQDGVEDADSDSENELQNLSISRDTLYLERGGFAKLPADQIDDADNDPTNELQTLSLIGDTLKIANRNQVIFTYDSSQWINNKNKIYYNTGNVGVGSTNPISKLEVKSTATTGALFQVINADNDTVFAVYPDGVKVFVNPEAKGKIGGFAVSGRNPAKGNSVDIMRVTGDSTRFYVNETLTKGRIGGFAVSGRNPAKGIAYDYLVVTGDSTRIYVNDTSTNKGKIGGFAVSGRNPAKGSINEYLQVTRDSTRIYIEESGTKGKIGGFAVSGRNPAKNGNYEFLRVTSDSTRIFTKDTISGFGVGNLSTGASESYLKLTPNNYLIGHNSGKSITSGLFNSFMGYEAGFSTDTGKNNIFIGYRAGFINEGGKSNLFIGNMSGYSNIWGRSNVYLGYKAGYGNTGGSFNTYLGFESAADGTNGSYNTFIGYQTGKLNRGTDNVFMGYLAGSNSETGSSNVFIGNSSGLVTSGIYNVFIGHQTGLNNTSGNANVFMGYQSGESNTIGISNVFIGNRSGRNNTMGRFNVFMGRDAGVDNVDGESNVFIGDFSGSGNISGIMNTYLGIASGRYATGSSNIFIGPDAGSSGLVVGDTNIFIGNAAGNRATGSHNIFIGDNAGRWNEGSNNIIIGKRNSSLAGTNNILSITDLIYGEMDNEFLLFDADVRVTGLLSIGYNTTNSNGSIRWTGSDLEGMVNDTWVSLTSKNYLRPLDQDPWWALYVNEDGRIGLNTATPQDWLHIWSASSSYRGIKVSNANPHLVLDDITISADDYELSVNSNAFYINHDSNDDGTFESNRFYINSSGRIYAGGNMGINTTPGTNALHVNGSTYLAGTTNIAGVTGINKSATSLYGLYVGGGSSCALAVDGYTYLENIGVNTSPASTLSINVQGNSAFYGNVGIMDSPNSNYGLCLGAGTTHALYAKGNVHSNGNVTLYGSVGIGTTSPAEKLHVVGDIRLNGGGDIAFADDNTRIYESSDDLFFTADDDIYLSPDDDIYINGDGGASWVRFDNGGKRLGIGTTSPDYLVDIYDNTSKLFAVNIFKDYNSSSYGGIGVQAGSDGGSGTNLMVACYNGAGAYKGGLAIINNNYASLVSPSDRRLKMNIEETDLESLKIINDLRVVDFEYKDSPGIERLGFIAQEVEDVYPRMVSYNEIQDIYEINQMELIPVLTKAMQEQEEKINKLEKENELLKQKLDEILKLLKN